MPRKKKQDIKVNNNASLEALMQETYNDACLQIINVQTTINELTVGSTPEDVDDITKIIKEKGNLLKVKESSIRIKLEIAKLQNDIIKNNGDSAAAINQVSGGSVELSDFQNVRDLIKINAAKAAKAAENDAGETNDN